MHVDRKAAAMGTAVREDVHNWKDAMYTQQQMLEETYVRDDYVHDEEFIHMSAPPTARGVNPTAMDEEPPIRPL